jgi:hypothetical protein
VFGVGYDGGNWFDEAVGDAFPEAIEGIFSILEDGLIIFRGGFWAASR